MSDPASTSTMPPKSLLVVYALGAFSTVLNITMISPLLVPVAAEFARSEASVGQLSTITAACAFGTALVIAPTLDRYPRRVWLRWQIGLVGFASILTAVANSFTVLIAARALAGIGGAIIIALCYASAADNFPVARQRNRVVGMIASAATLGSIIGLPIVTLIEDAVGWRWAVLLMAPLTLVVFVGAGQLRDSPPPGHVMSVNLWSRRYRQVLSHRPVASLLGVLIVILIVRFGWFLYFGAYTEHEFRASASTLGLAFAVGGVAHLLGSNAAPILLGRYSPRRIAGIAAGLMALDLMSIGLYSDQVWSVFPFIFIFSASWATCLVSCSILLLDSAATMRSTVTALQSAAMEIGVGAGAAIGGLLLSGFDSYERSFRSLAVLIPVVLFLLVVSSPERERRRPGAMPVPVEGSLV